VKVIDKHLLREMVKFVFIALGAVVVIYLLIDLFEELNYFTSRKAGFFTIVLYYVYSLPAAITLLYPVSLLLGVFLVYGQLTRHRELAALESAGVKATRLFVPAAAVGLATVLLYLGGNELLAIPAAARLSDLRRYKIEKRSVATAQQRKNLYMVGEQGRVFFMREFLSSGTMRGFTIKELGSDRKVVRRIDGTDAMFREGRWVAHGVELREFRTDGTEELAMHDSLVLEDIPEKPADFMRTPRPVGETSTKELRKYIAKLRRAGENVAHEEVEYHYRFSYSLIGLIVVLLGLPLSVRLRRGGVMFGLGLGLLVSFLYWGAIQMSRAYGTSHVVSPAMAAWMPNILFAGVAVVLWLKVRQ